MCMRLGLRGFFLFCPTLYYASTPCQQQLRVNAAIGADCRGHARMAQCGSTCVLSAQSPINLPDPVRALETSQNVVDACKKRQNGQIIRPGL